jgi:hypothetical protein
MVVDGVAVCCLVCNARSYRERDMHIEMLKTVSVVKKLELAAVATVHTGNSVH